MIQFNLLPDVKKDYIKAKKTKRLIFSVSIIATIASVSIVVSMFGIVQIAQKQNIEDLTKDIQDGVASVNSINELDKILTIQRQLESLPGLHEQKPQTSRIFEYLTQFTPADVKVSSLNLSFEESRLTIEGSAPSIASINRYADTIKFAKFKYILDDTSTNNLDGETNNMSEETVAFSDVTTELSRNEEIASYKMTFTFDPILFDNTKEVSLIIPNTVTTRSTQGRPTISNNDDNPLFESNSEGGVNE